MLPNVNFLAKNFWPFVLLGHGNEKKKVKK